MTGLLLPTSDLDMVAMTEFGSSPECLRLVGAELVRRQLSGEIRDLEIISAAKVPIVTYTHSASGVNCDIRFNQTNSRDSAEGMRRLMHDYQPARPLAMVSAVHNSTYLTRCD